MEEIDWNLSELDKVQYAVNFSSTNLCSSVRISVVPIRSGNGKSWSNEPVANNDAFR